MLKEPIMREPNVGQEYRLGEVQEGFREETKFKQLKESVKDQPGKCGKRRGAEKQKNRT